MSLPYFPTWPVDGPPPLPPVHGLLPAATSPAAGVRIVTDTTVGPVDENDIAPNDAGLEPGLYRKPDGSIFLRVAGGDERVWVPEEAGRERWLNGGAVYPYPPNVPETWDACDTSGRGEKSDGENVTPPEFAAITVVEAITCTSQQIPNQAAFRGRAVNVLAATESFAVARALLTGAGIVGTRYLADDGCTFPNGQVATRPNHGLQVLEEAIAATGRLGVIHCSPMLATALLGQGFVIKDVTGVIRTINGIVVIPDFGYAEGATPLGASVEPGPTEEWAYATGPVDVRRSDIFTTPDTVSEALDRGTSDSATRGRPNSITYYAERYFLTVWDTALQAAVLIDRCGTTCEVGS